MTETSTTPASRMRPEAEWLVTAIFVALAVALGIATLLTTPLLPIALLILTAVVLTVLWRPTESVIGYLGITPIIVGLSRGAVVPGARLNEVFLLALCAALSLAVALGRLKLPSPTRADSAVLLLAVFSSVTSWLWMFARDVPFTSDDLAFGLVLWKYFALYCVVRITVRTAAQRRLALKVFTAALIPVALLGLTQALGFAPSVNVAAAYRADDDSGGVASARATSTVGSPIAFADLMTIGLVIALSSLLLNGRRRGLLMAASALFALSALSSGQVTAVAALIIGLLVVGISTQRLGLVAGASTVIGLVATIVLQPVIAARLSTSDGAASGGILPSAWTGPTGRIGNLTHYVLPQLFDGQLWILGVRTAARIPALESWRQYVWIESGYVWLLWTGGIPLLAAFLYFVLSGLRTSLRAQKSRLLSDRLVGITSAATFWLVATLMVLDTHLTMRGVADALFPLAALCIGAATQSGLARSDTP